MRTKTVFIIGAVVVASVVIIWFLARRDEIDQERPPTLKPPINVKVEAGDAKIEAEWDPVEGADYYTIDHSLKPDFTKEEATVLSPIDEPSLQMTCVPAGRYYFKITSSQYVKASRFDPRKIPVESDESPVRVVVVNKCSAPSPPTNVSAERRGEKIDLKWSPVVEADGYHLYINGQKAQKIDDPLTDTYTINAAGVQSIGVSAFGEHCGSSEVVMADE